MDELFDDVAGLRNPTKYCNSSLCSSNSCSTKFVMNESCVVTEPDELVVTDSSAGGGEMDGVVLSESLLLYVELLDCELLADVAGLCTPTKFSSSAIAAISASL